MITVIISGFLTIIYILKEDFNILLSNIEPKKLIKMGVNEDDVMNIMGGMEHAGGIKLNDHKRKLKNRYIVKIICVL